MCHRPLPRPPPAAEEPQEPLLSHQAAAGRPPRGAPLLAPAPGGAPLHPAPLAHRGWRAPPAVPLRTQSPARLQDARLSKPAPASGLTVTCFSRKHVHRGPGGPARPRGGSLRSLGERHWGWGRSLLLRRDRGFRNLLTSPKAQTRHRQPRRQGSSGHNEPPPPSAPPPPAHWCPPIGSSSRPRRSAAIAKSKEKGQWAGRSG